jgi:hypothetical protein
MTMMNERAITPGETRRMRQLSRMTEEQLAKTAARDLRAAIVQVNHLMMVAAALDARRDHLASNAGQWTGYAIRGADCMDQLQAAFRRLELHWRTPLDEP